MITPSQSLRKPFGRCSKIWCAMASISASEGALALVHIITAFYRVLRRSASRFEYWTSRAVDVGAAIGDVAAVRQLWVGGMMRIRTAAILLFFAGVFSLPAAGVEAQTAPAGMRTAQASQPMVTEASAQRRFRRPARLRVYPSYQGG